MDYRRPLTVPTLALTVACSIYPSRNGEVGIYEAPDGKIGVYRTPKEDANPNGGDSASGDSNETGTVGSADAGGLGAAGSGGSNGSDQSNCRYTCDAFAAVCITFCLPYTNAAAKIDCENLCENNKDSCYAQCNSRGGSNVNDLSACQYTCSANGATCNTACLLNFDAASKEDCENLCIQDMTSCHAQC